jgi:cysteine-S-conjugate beta-lyase
MGQRSGDGQGNGPGVSDSEAKIETRLVEAGRRKEWTSRIVSAPVYRASTVLFDSVADLEAAGKGSHGTFHYGRNGTPTQWALAEALTELEPGAAGTMLFPSGAAAVAMALSSVLRPGDELLMVDSAYGPTRHFCDTVLKRMGIATRYYDPLVGEGIEALIGPKTRALFLESPGSLTFEVQDVPAMCRIAKARGLVTLMDNTWATPLLFPAIAAGVDLAILACTKYIGGHSDAMLGSVTATAERFDALDRTGKAFGQFVSPDDCFLASRGLRTLAVRLARHGESALTVARWLADRPEVVRVLHPALVNCPGHDVFFRDFAGASGLFAIELKGGKAERAQVIDALKRFGIGYSWGGFESLAVPADPAAIRTATHWQGEGALIRIHIGLEDPADLIADLDHALAGLRNAG